MDQSLIEQSKRKFIVPENKIPNTDQINTGCLQRIATATETMSEGFAAVLEKLEQSEKKRKSIKAHGIYLSPNGICWNASSMATKARLRKCGNKFRNLKMANHDRIDLFSFSVNH
jgi:hypothetical protein